MDFETVNLIMAKPKHATLYLCRNCAIDRDGDIARIAVGVDTLNEVEEIKLTDSCPDCWEE